MRGVLVRGVLIGWVALAMLPGVSEAEKISWGNELPEACRAAMKLQRPVLVVFTMSDCHFCERMKAETLRDQDIISQINRGFVPVLINSDNSGKLAEQWVKALHVDVFPTTLMVTPKGKVVGRFNGYASPSEMQDKIDIALKDHGTPKTR